MSTIIHNVGASGNCAVEMGIVGTSIFAVGVMAYGYYQKRKRKQIQKKYSVRDNSSTQNVNVTEVTEGVQDNSSSQKSGLKSRSKMRSDGEECLINFNTY